jgi:hypothetical protein
MCETWISRDLLYLQVLYVWADRLQDCIRPAKELFYVFLSVSFDAFCRLFGMLYQHYEKCNFVPFEIKLRFFSAQGGENLNKLYIFGV